MKRILASIVAGGVLGSIAVLGLKINHMAEAETATAERTAALPDIAWESLEGRSMHANDISDGRPIVLIYFRTTCPFCQSEAKSVRANNALRSESQIFMISSEPGPVLQRFASDHGLSRVQGIKVVRDPEGEMARLFGISVVPTTFVYGSDGMLLGRLKGGAGAEEIYGLLTRTDGADFGAVTAEGCLEQESTSHQATECTPDP